MNSVNKRIYLSSPHMSGREMHYIREAFDQNWVAPLGPNVDNFEKDIQAYLGVKHAAALSSGTAAIHLALILLGVGPGDYVIVQSFTFSATVNPIIYCGATPVFIDSDPGTWNMDPDLLEAAINKCINGDLVSSALRPQPSSVFPPPSALRPQPSSLFPPPSALRPQSSSLFPPPSALRPLPSLKPKAIIPVHLYGMPANMDRILDIAEKYDIPVIEDAAEALGSRYRNKPAGSLGEMGILSFNGNKIITTSGGGALVSDSEEYIKKARFFATQARDKAPHYQHSQIGYNYRMSNISAGIGRGQIEILEERVEQRRKNFEFYKGNLSGITGVIFHEEPGPGYFSNRWLTTITIDTELTGKSREDVRRALESQNIESRPLWKPMHLQPVFRDFPALINGVSEELFNKGLCLPSGSNLTDDDREKILDYLLRIFGK